MICPEADFFPTHLQDTKASARICRVCYNSYDISYNFGAMCCQSCTAFFRRAVRGKSDFECKRNPVNCGDTALYEVTAAHACKRCRFERCLREGMKAECD
ncbi:hypothetical protein QR680_006592 [Steinernema hermaphroditum]|uniref:Nuclear receptor domain-containing protein n=1 Tax=Steinernema hermaphroditum TaxID=289476 RepID=A0AA39LXD2_9BILA|nr:hypothetical protein QR680_006592 [Steinernema hermaphroditum]